MEDGLPEAVATKLNPIERYGVRASLFALALGLVGIPFGLLLEQVTRHGALTRADTSLANSLHERVRGDHALTVAMETLSFLGKPVFLIPFVAIPIGLLLWTGARKLALFLAMTCIGGAVVDTIVKEMVGRSRPHFNDPIATALGKSFPSGHAMSSTICYGAVLLVALPLVRRFRVPLIAFTALLVLGIGVSRLALGVHYLSDVLGGYVLGAAWLTGSVALFEIWRVERGRPKTAPLSEGVEPEETGAIS